MSTITCPVCSADTPAEYNFCVTCDKQIKCLNPDCNKLLVAGKTFCFTCGQPIASVLAQAGHPNRYQHTVKQKGDNYEESTEWNVSDHAVSELAPFIVDGVTMRAHQRTIYQGRRNGPNAPSDTQREAITGQTDTTPLLSQGESGATTQPEQTGGGAEKKDSKEGAARYFVQDGEYLVASHKDFRGKNWAEQQRRFILLYAAAYPKFFDGKPVPSRDHFVEAAKRASIIDLNNFGKDLTGLCRRELTQVSSGFAIGSDGEIEVNKIIINIEDEKAEAGYPYWEHGPQSPTTKFRLSNEDKARIKNWTQEDVQLGSFDIRTINNARDYAMFALWLITVRLKKAETVRWNDAYYFLKEKFPAITATPNGFSKAITNPKNANVFRSIEDRYFLSPDGQAEVEKWIAGTAAPSSTGEATGD
jgi:hypothetical protein